MKKRFTLLLVFFVNIIYICYSQAPEGRLKKVESVQIIFFTKELTLTQDELGKFWPIYRNYKNEIKVARKLKGDDQLALEENILNIRKKYRTEFKSVLGSDDRVNKVFVTEKNFWEMLRKELIKRKMTEGGKEEDVDN